MICTRPANATPFGTVGPGFRRDDDLHSPDLDRVILDHRVGEELPTHLLDAGARHGRIGIGQVELDQLALAHFADPVEAEPLQGVADRLPLRVENPRLQADVDARLHRPAGYCTAFGALKSPGPPSGRMPRRRATSW